MKKQLKFFKFLSQRKLADVMSAGFFMSTLFFTSFYSSGAYAYDLAEVESRTGDPQTQDTTAFENTDSADYVNPNFDNAGYDNADPENSGFAKQPDHQKATSRNGFTASHLAPRMETKSSLKNSLYNEVELLRNEVQTLRGQLEVQSHDLQLLRKRQKDLYMDIDRRLSQSAHPSASDANLNNQIRSTNQSTISSNTKTSKNINTALSNAESPEVNPATMPDQNQLYRKAYYQLKRKQYTQARRAFEQLVELYPRGPFTANAQYWLGEMDLLDGNLVAANEHFNRVVTQFPRHAKSADSLLKLGMIRLDQGKSKEARDYFVQVRQRFPGSSSAILAKRQLEGIK